MLGCNRHGILRREAPQNDTCCGKNPLLCGNKKITNCKKQSVLLLLSRSTCGIIRYNKQKRVPRLPLEGKLSRRVSGRAVTDEVSVLSLARCRTVVPGSTSSVSPLAGDRGEPPSPQGEGFKTLPIPVSKAIPGSREIYVPRKFPRGAKTCTYFPNKIKGG